MRIKPASHRDLLSTALAPAWMAAAMLTAILLLLAFAVTPAAAADEGDIQRGIDAAAARYQALGEFYQAQSESAIGSIQRGVDAATARYEAMREYYQGQSEIASGSIQRGIDAATARYEAMREYYQAQSATMGDSIQRGIDAGTARYEALAEAHRVRGETELEANPELGAALPSYDLGRFPACVEAEQRMNADPVGVFYRRLQGC